MASVTCSAQSELEKEIDISLLSQRVIKIDCDFGTPAKANDCVRRIVPTLIFRAANYTAQQATLLLKVTYKEIPDPNTGQPTVSIGSAFLIDHERGYVLTAKHVLMGTKIW